MSKMGNVNAKTEFLNELKNIGFEHLVCAQINKVVLPQFFTQEEYEAFLNSIDFTYDAGYGGQELDGTVWFDDGSWLERGEYDGSEWWNHMKYPEIPENLKRNN